MDVASYGYLLMNEFTYGFDLKNQSATKNKLKQSMMRQCFFFICILCFACRKDPPPLPGKSFLLFPKNNEICADGIIVSAVKSKILFKWEASKNTDSYVLSIKNLENGQISTHMTDKTQLEIELDRNLAYSWFILSKNTKINKELSSDVWKFYNPAPAQTTFSPFPAELLSPKYEETIPVTTEKISLKWSCTDPDGDVINYDVYLGISPVPLLYKSGIKETVLADLILDRSKSYYWKVVAIDSKGNKSHSDIYSFKLN